MFDKLGDMSKMLSEAKQLQQKQDRFQEEQLDLLRKILSKLDEVINLLKNR
ncbi:MAG: hypothetical protein NC914_00885 [Candidatus Omnitrophica bacterium]|nr:hypothetical protein [Candidatus Omnitrophota bacterium]